MIPTHSTKDNSNRRLPELDLIELVGSGAYGEVWLARNAATGAMRAVKIVTRAAFSDDRPFRREFEGIVRFDTISRNHPSQLCLFQVGKNDDEGYFYYAMELADPISTNGPYRPRTLRADLQRGRYTAAHALELAIALAEALLHLHSNGLVHRDVKPSNIIFVNGRPKLADIGLVTDGNGERTILGTEGYLSTDCAGTPKADLYALGKVLYEAVTGMDRRDFPKLPDNLLAWDDRQLVCELNEIILKACADKVDDRYATADQLLRELQSLANGKSIRKKRARKRVATTLGKGALALCLIAMLAMVGVFLSIDSYSETNALGPYSSNSDATRWCEQGKAFVRGDAYGNFPNAYRDFHRAIELDPKYVRPYVCLFELLIREPMPGVQTQTNELRAIRDKLIELAPKRASTFTARSVYDFFDYHFPEAEKEIREAIRRDPNYELGHTWYAFMLHCWGRTEECRRQIRISENITPAKSIVFRVLGHSYFAERNFAEAINFYRRALEMQDHHVIALRSIGDALRAQGDYLAAITNYSLADTIVKTDDPATRAHRLASISAFQTNGPDGYWREEMIFAERSEIVGNYQNAVIQIHLRNTNGALTFLNKSYQTHERRGDLETPLVYLLYDEHWDGIRKTPEFSDLVAKVGFPAVLNPPKETWSDSVYSWLSSLR